jgi:putative protease
VRKLIDVDHLMGHLWGKRDYFVTYDRNFLRKRDKLYTICGAVVCTPQECPKKIEEGGVQMAEKEVGRVSDFFARPVVAGIELTAPLKVGDKIHIKGHTTEMEMVVESMQINNVDVKEAKPGDAIGIKVPDRVRRGDQVYKVTE